MLNNHLYINWLKLPALLSYRTYSMEHKLAFYANCCNLSLQ